jgi:ferritin-like metal-binding protein YciE
VNSRPGSCSSPAHSFAASPRNQCFCDGFAKVTHSEITRYGTLKTWAKELGLTQSVRLLEATLSEEKKTDDTLTKLAESDVNHHAQAA